MVDRRGLQLVKDFQLTNSGPDNLPCPLVHLLSGPDGNLDSCQLVGFLLSPQTIKLRFHVHQVAMETG